MFLQLSFETVFLVVSCGTSGVLCVFVCLLDLCGFEVQVLLPCWAVGTLPYLYFLTLLLLFLLLDMVAVAASTSTAC